MLDTRDPDLKSLVPTTPLSRRGFVTTSLAGGFALATLPVAASTITTDDKGLVAGEVSIAVRDGRLPGYRAMPRAGGARPTILVVQEIFGVHEHIRDLCRRFAKVGYCAIAPELYARQGNPAAVADVRELMSTLVAKVADAQVMADLDDTISWGVAEGCCDPDKVGVTGFCWGGRITWLYAAHNPRLKAGVAWYGRLVGDTTPLQPRNPVDVVAELKAPVLGLYGAADQGIPMDTVATMRKALEAAKSPSMIVAYEDTPHGFLADYRASYREAAAKDGWERALAWFRQHGVG